MNTNKLNNTSKHNKKRRWWQNIKTTHNPLKKLIKAIIKSTPTSTEYLVVAVAYDGNHHKHFTITPSNKDKIISTLTELSSNKEITSGFGFSDSMIFLKEGMNIKSYTITTNAKFKEHEKQAHSKHMFTKINKKRSGGFFPHVHIIENEYVNCVGTVADLQKGCYS